MRLELLPLWLGGVVALIGLAILYDAFGDPESGPLRERRRRIRERIDQMGERLVGGGILLFGVALVGRDSWRYVNVAVLLGALLVIWGGVRNRRYIREMLLFRGAARRGR